MYQFDNGQISLENFGQPVGMDQRNSNRWGKLILLKGMMVIGQ